MVTHDWIDYINARSTAVIAVFTILLFLGVIWQNRTSRNIERAWVMAQIDGDRAKWSDGKVHIVEGSGTGGDSTGTWIILSCHNEGKSPAWIYEKRVKFPDRCEHSKVCPCGVHQSTLFLNHVGAVVDE